MGEILADDARALDLAHAGSARPGQPHELLGHQPLAAAEQLALVPVDLHFVTGENDQAAAEFDELLQVVDLVAVEFIDVGEDDDSLALQAVLVQLPAVDHLGGDQVGEPAAGCTERLQRDLEEPGLALQRFVRRVAIHHQHGHLVPHLQALHEGVVGLQRIGRGGDLDMVRARLLEGVGKQHLRFLPRRERDLGGAHLHAIDLEHDHQVRVGGLAVVLEVGAQHHPLADAEDQRRDVDRFDAGVLARPVAHLVERQVRVDLELAELFQRRLPRRRFGIPPVRGLEVGDDHHVARRVLHLVELGRRSQQAAADADGIALAALELQLRCEVVARGRRLVEHALGFAAEQDHRAVGPVAHAVERQRDLLSGAGEVRAGGRAVLHRETIVEQEHGRGLGVLAILPDAGQDRPRQAQREDHGDRDPDQQQQQLLQPDALVVLAHDRCEQVHRPPLDLLEAALVEDVDDQRQRERRHAAEQYDVEETHRVGRSIYLSR